MATPVLVSQKAKTPKKPVQRIAPRRIVASTMSYNQYQKLTVINQIRRAFMPGARLSAVIGGLLGGAIPVSTYVLIHNQLGVATTPSLWLLVAGGLLYSAPTVFQWATAAFGSKLKSVGFTLLMEGILTFAHIHFLTFLSLGILVFINTVSAACSLQVRKEDTTEDSFLR